MTESMLAYQYLQMLPQIAQGDANKVWIVPSEIGRALEGLGGFFPAGMGSRDRPHGGDHGAGRAASLRADGTAERFTSEVAGPSPNGGLAEPDGAPATLPDGAP